VRELQCLQVCQGQYRAEQLVYVAALACGIPLVFGDRPKDITYRQVTTRLQLVGPSNHTCHCLAAVTHHYVHLMLVIVHNCARLCSRLYTLPTCAQLDQGFGAQAAINYLEMLGQPPPVVPLDDAPLVHRIAMHVSRAGVASGRRT
jgi:hypothetical protein